MTEESIKDYLERLPRGDSFNELEPESKEAWVFDAKETLFGVYPSWKVKERHVALQVLYMMEEEEEDFGRLRRHCVTTANTKGTSVSLACNENICPEVIRLIGRPRYAHGGRVGRLV